LENKVNVRESIKTDEGLKRENTDARGTLQQRSGQSRREKITWTVTLKYIFKSGKKEKKKAVIRVEEMQKKTSRSFRGGGRRGGALAIGNLRVESEIGRGGGGWVGAGCAERGGRGNRLAGGGKVCDEKRHKLENQKG